MVVNNEVKLKAYKNIKITYLQSIKNLFPLDYQKIEQYEEDKAGVLRWALKPIFLKYLIEKCNYKKAIFLDPDLCFFKDANFLFELLEHKDVIITPHWRSKQPAQDKTNFNLLFSEGLFNAGFFGCNHKSIDLLDWWLDMCSYDMKKTDGFYVDQGFLNLFPIYFSNRVKIITHKGCNVSNWNTVECKRTKSEHEILINNEYPIVFIHFTNATISQIFKGKDRILSSYLDYYGRRLKAHRPDFKFKHEIEPSKKKKKSIISKVLSKLKTIN